MRETYMWEALAEARLAGEAGEIPVGAVVVCNGEIVARAHNEREGSLDPTAHAEVLALRRAAKRLGRRRLAGCELYVTLEPCPMCAGAIALAGLDAVFFGAYDPKAGCAGSRYALCEDEAFGRPTPCMGAMLETECEAALDAFFVKKRESKRVEGQIDDQK